NGALVSSPTVTTAKGTLTVTAYDPVTGKVTYSYTLTDDQTHAAGQGDNSTTGPLFDDLDVVLTDYDNQPASGTLSVKIVDDVPDAKNDTDTVKAGTQSETGNVITGVGTNEGPGGLGTDVKGADGATVTQIESATGGTKAVSTTGTTEIDGQYGKLKIAADGSYTYTRDAGTPGNVDDVFTYTLKDGDGDADTAKLTIKIENGTPTITDLTPKASGGDTTVYEDGLPDGSLPTTDRETNTGDFTITSPDGVKS
ncbi:VCBS domain-containing protein, partial [Pseudochelatococcus lubricantis]|uniref:VCBS domain-containing protein n=1 Tax=Pseudochelatococcus lubricantis TaxID=1538102 RepID=UPI0035EAC941